MKFDIQILDIAKGTKSFKNLTLSQVKAFLRAANKNENLYKENKHWPFHAAGYRLKANGAGVFSIIVNKALEV